MSRSLRLYTIPEEEDRLRSLGVSFHYPSCEVCGVLNRSHYPIAGDAPECGSWVCEACMPMVDIGMSEFLKEDREGIRTPQGHELPEIIPLDM
jgi:hypothetical protein